MLPIEARKRFGASRCFDAYTFKRGNCEVVDKHSNLHDEVSLSWMILLHDNFAVRVHIGERHQ